MWSNQSLRKHLESRLGGPLRKVELDQTNYTEAIKRAIDQVTAVKPLFKHGQLNIIQGSQSYDLVALNKPFGKGILQVFDQPITSPQAVFNEFEWYRLRQPPYVDIGELTLDNMYYKEIGLHTGTQFDWYWDPDTKKLLFAPVPTRSRTISYLYNDVSDRIEDVRPVDQSWVVDYSLAICKEMLGRVRQKFQGVPGHDLPVVTDGADLLSEGLKSQEELTEKLWKMRGDWVPPVKA